MGLIKRSLFSFPNTCTTNLHHINQSLQHWPPGWQQHHHPLCSVSHWPGHCLTAGHWDLAHTPVLMTFKTLAEQQGFQPGWNSGSGNPRVSPGPEKLSFVWADLHAQGNFCMLRALAGFPRVRSEQRPKNPTWSHRPLELLTSSPMATSGFCEPVRNYFLSLGSLVFSQLQVHQLSQRSFKLLY